MEKCPLGQGSQVLQANIAAVMTQSAVCFPNETCKDTKSACLPAVGDTISIARHTLAGDHNLLGLSG